MPGPNDEWGGLANGELHLAYLRLSPAFHAHPPVFLKYLVDLRCWSTLVTNNACMQLLVSRVVSLLHAHDDHHTHPSCTHDYIRWICHRGSAATRQFRWPCCCSGRSHASKISLCHKASRSDKWFTPALG